MCTLTAFCVTYCAVCVFYNAINFVVYMYTAADDEDRQTDRQTER